MPDPAQFSHTATAAPKATVTYEMANPRLRRTEIRHMAEALASRVAGGRGFACLVAGPEALRHMNRDFRGKDESTDVLSFPSASCPGGAAPFLGDLAISIEHARTQARERGHSVEQEIGVLMLHGLLHLLGMDHETDRGQMRRAEARWCREMGLPVSLTERASLVDRAKRSPGSAAPPPGGVPSKKTEPRARLQRTFNQTRRQS